MQLPGVVLVEGASDRRAVETLARRRGRDLRDEGVTIVPMGGYGNLPRLLGTYRDVRLAGLYDVGEERHFLRALGCDDRGELERAGFYACTRDLEDELTRAVGPDGMERLLAEQGELRAFRTYQKQPAHRARPLEEQLHGFMWNRKQKYAVLLVEALDLKRVQRPLDRVLAHFELSCGRHAVAAKGLNITFRRLKGPWSPKHRSLRCPSLRSTSSPRSTGCLPARTASAEARARVFLSETVRDEPNDAREATPPGYRSD